jgi:hypothetical protein
MVLARRGQEIDLVDINPDTAAAPTNVEEGGVDRRDIAEWPNRFG